MGLEASVKDFFNVAASIEGLLQNSIHEIMELKNQTDTNRLQYSLNLLLCF